ncbi:MAG: hypothetical protein DMD46_16610 [Gemmatimonadetes bacterium]|nr:MAG: hypothetical protein DMD46_16610 [Gemmatimonadota bacterium]
MPHRLGGRAVAQPLAPAAQSRGAAGDETVAVKPSTGGEYVHTFRQMFRHAVDHSSYHRGQIVTMLRQLGVTPPTTGLIYFYREVAHRVP